MRALSILAVLACLVSSIGCGGAGDVGQSCERPGSTEDCVDGAICAQDESMEGASSDPTWDSFTCRQICDVQRDCQAGLECRGVSGAFEPLRACQPPRNTTP